MSSNADQMTYWNEVAGAKWVANQARLDRVFAPLTKGLIAAAALKTGEHVLDVGCGCGETSLIAADAVGAGGHVLAIDISVPMLDHAKSRAAASAGKTRAPIEWLQADAMTHPFSPQADLLISRFGVMFFADPEAAFANLRRGLKPGARASPFISWRPRAEVEWMQWPLDQVAAVLPPPEVMTGQPGPFGFADATATQAMLARAGFTRVSAAPLDAPLVLGDGADPVGDAMRLLLDTGPVATLVREAEADARAKAEALLRAGARSPRRRRRDGAGWPRSGRIRPLFDIGPLAARGK